MGNDYPQSVWTTEAGADAEVARLKARDAAAFLKENPGRATRFTGAGEVYWRWFEFELQGDENGKA
jgi:hypothetical protein